MTNKIIVDEQFTDIELDDIDWVIRDAIEKHETDVGNDLCHEDGITYRVTVTAILEY